MRKGFSALFVVIMVFFIAAPFVFYFVVSREKTGVKGASSSAPIKEGFSVTLNSAQGTWDLYEYGCSTLEECSGSLFSGKKLSIISGGKISNHTIGFSKSLLSEDSQFIKLFVKPGWGSMQRNFKLSPDAEQFVKAVDFNYEGAVIKALIVTRGAFDSGYFSAGTFSD